MLVIGKRSASDQQVCKASLGGRSRLEESGEEGGRFSVRNKERFIVIVATPIFFSCLEIK